MKKILFVSNYSTRIGSFSTASIAAAKKVGFEFLYASNWSKTPKEDIESDEKQYGVRILDVSISRSPYSPSNKTAYNKLVKIIKDESVDFLHCNTAIGGFVGRLAGKKCGTKKIIYQAHGYHFFKGAPIINWILYYPLERWLLHYTDALITINKEDYERSKKFRLRKGGKIYYVPGVGTDLSKFENVEVDRHELRSQLRLKDDDIVCISMGYLVKDKNYPTAIKAIAHLKNPKIQYIICGQGKELGKLRKLSRKLGVENQVHFLGFRTDIPELLKISDVFFFTTAREGLPRSTMEAMASSLPIACSRVRGNTDLVEDGKGGVLFYPKDFRAAAKAIETVIASDMEKMGAYNKEKVKQFEVKVAQDAMFDVYKDFFADEIEE